MDAEKQLDSIYHTLPEWINAQFPDEDLATRIIYMKNEYLKRIAEYSNVTTLEKAHRSEMMKFAAEKLGISAIDFLFEFNEWKNKTMIDEVQ